VLLLALGSSVASRQNDPPVISKMYPDDNEDDIDVNDDIEITFNKRMAKSETETAFSISPNENGEFSWQNDFTLVFKPNSPLKYESEYTITISTAAKSENGLNLTEEVAWNFITEAKVENNDNKDDDWWKTWEPIVTVATVLGTAVAAGIGYYRIRKKRGQLRKYMVKIDSTYDEHRKDPQTCENRLVSLKEWLKVKVKQGMVDEYHYLILDKKIDDYLHDIRFRKSLPKPKIIKGVEKDIQAELEKKMKEHKQETEKPEKSKEPKKPPRPKIIAD
jgi:hypothetical protein